MYSYKPRPAVTTSLAISHYSVALQQTHFGHRQVLLFGRLLPVIDGNLLLRLHLHQHTPLSTGRGCPPSCHGELEPTVLALCVLLLQLQLAAPGPVFDLRKHWQQRSSGLAYYFLLRMGVASVQFHVVV